MAQALLRWAARLCLDEELAIAEPNRMRQRLLHVPGRLVRSRHRVALRLPHNWPWAEALVAVFARLRALPVTSGHSHRLDLELQSSSLHLPTSACPRTSRPSLTRRR